LPDKDLVDLYLLIESYQVTKSRIDFIQLLCAYPNGENLVC
jgi:hypothetical protein